MGMKSNVLIYSKLLLFTYSRKQTFKHYFKCYNIFIQLTTNTICTRIYQKNKMQNTYTYL
jgi:hypothetical protein